jgi:hypothetical protein
LITLLKRSTLDTGALNLISKGMGHRFVLGDAMIDRSSF